MKYILISNESKFDYTPYNGDGEEYDYRDQAIKRAKEICQYAFDDYNYDVTVHVRYKHNYAWGVTYSSDNNSDNFFKN